MISRIVVFPFSMAVKPRNIKKQSFSGIHLLSEHIFEIAVEWKNIYRKRGLIPTWSYVLTQFAIDSVHAKFVSTLQ